MSDLAFYKIIAGLAEAALTTAEARIAELEAERDEALKEAAHQSKCAQEWFDDMNIAQAASSDLEVQLRSAEAREKRLREALEEGLTSAWCDAVLGIAPHLIEAGRAAAFREAFYDWQRRSRAALSQEPEG